MRQAALLCATLWWICAMQRRLCRGSFIHKLCACYMAATRFFGIRAAADEKRCCCAMPGFLPISWPFTALLPAVYIIYTFIIYDIIYIYTYYTYMYYW